jgi:hypothetical protein
MEKYAITVEVRDENHKLIKDEKGFNTTGIRFELEVKDEDQLEHRIKEIGNNLKVWMPNRNIDIDASVFNGISGTYMSMYGFYVNENRYVKFT